MPGAASIHPDERVHQVIAIAVYRDGAHPLGSATEGDDPLRRDEAPGEQSSSRRRERPPPVVRVLLGATVRRDNCSFLIRFVYKLGNSFCYFLCTYTCYTEVDRQY